MIVISKLFTIFILPPGCIIVGLILCIVFLPRRYKLIPALITALLYCLSIQPVSDALLLPLEDSYPPLARVNGEAHNAIEAIVVLGGGNIQNSPDAGPGQDTLAVDALKRAVYAFSLKDDFPAVYVFSGGIVLDYGQEPEAVTAGRLFADLGLPAERLIPETRSRNTWQNAQETAKLGYQQVLLVTSAYHMRRSVFCFERNGMTVIPAPTDYKCNRGRGYDFFSFMPAMGSLNLSWLALHEYVGLFCYRLIYRSKRV